MPVTITQGQKEAHDFLAKHKIGVLATVDPNGEPHAAAIYYFADSALNITFITKTHTKKSDNLQHHNHAVLVVCDPKTQTTVQVTGLTTEIEDLLQVNDLLERSIFASIDTAKQSIAPLAKLKEGDYIAYRLTPKQIHMAVFSHPESGSFDDLFRTFTPT